MYKCPYCFEVVSGEGNKCPHCLQFLLDDVIKAEFASIDKKNCIYCGHKILQEARYCQHCQKWLDEIDRVVDNIDPEDLV